MALTFQVTRGGVTYDATVVRVNMIDLVAQTMEVVASYAIPNMTDPAEVREVALRMTKQEALDAGIVGSTFTNLVAGCKQGFIDKWGD